MPTVNANYRVPSGLLQRLHDGFTELSKMRKGIRAMFDTKTTWDIDDGVIVSFEKSVFFSQATNVPF